MPMFRAAPSNDLGTAIRQAISSSNLGPMAEIQADMAAATTAKNMGLAEKARAEVEAMQRAEADRTNQALATEYAGNVAGLDAPTATRLSNHLRGVLEQPSPADVADAGEMGREAQPFVTTAPVVTDGQKRGFQTALASLIANRLATGKTNADQLAQGTNVLNKTAAANEASDASDVPTANRLIAAVTGKVREPFKTNAQGVVLNEETGEVNEGTKLAGAVRGHVAAQAEKERAQGAAAAQGGKPPSGYAWGPKDAQGNNTLVPIAGGPKDPAGTELTKDGVEQAADRYRIDGTLPPNLGKGTQGAKNTATILNRAAEKAKEAGDDGEASRLRQIATKALSSALTQLSKQEAMVGAFEKNFNKNADLAIAQSDKVDRTGVPALNRWILAGKKNIAGDPDVAVLDVSMKAVINEYTKIISGSMGNAAMAEGEIKKVTDLLNSAHTPQQVRDVIAFMKKETGNRMTSFAEQKDELTKSMRASGAPKEQPKPTELAPVNAKGWKLMKDAQGNQAYVSPDGKQFEDTK